MDKELQAHKQDNKVTDTVEGKGGRRRFVKGLIITSPVVMTIVNRPAWARGCALSNQLSAILNASAVPEGGCSGEGCTPGFWHKASRPWSTAFPPHMLFDEAFGTAGVMLSVNAGTAGVFPGLTLLEVVNQLEYKSSEIADQAQRDDANKVRQLGHHAVAALQNAATSVKYDLTVEDVINNVYAAYSSGSYSNMESVKNVLDRLNNQGCPW